MFLIEAVPKGSTKINLTKAHYNLYHSCFQSYSKQTIFHNNLATLDISNYYYDANESL